MLDFLPKEATGALRLEAIGQRAYARLPPTSITAGWMKTYTSSQTDNHRALLCALLGCKPHCLGYYEFSNTEIARRFWHGWDIT